MRKITVALLLLTVTFAARARGIRAWTYEELYEQADLVVIVKPISTKDTGEKWILPDIGPATDVVGLSTVFEIRLVMKGDKSLKECTLHHYRLADTKRGISNGPLLVSFDPKDSPKYLLFLKKEADGRYAPVSGQTDPYGVSVQKLESFAR